MLWPATCGVAVDNLPLESACLVLLLAVVQAVARCGRAASIEGTPAGGAAFGAAFARPPDERFAAALRGAFFAAFFAGFFALRLADFLAVLPAFFVVFVFFAGFLALFFAAIRSSSCRDD